MALLRWIGIAFNCLIIIFVGSMKILLVSYKFYPNIGGIETIAMLLAREFVRNGHDVIVATDVVGEQPKELFSVERRPTWLRKLYLVKWADVVYHNSISLNYAWPLLLIRRPWVVGHHTWLRNDWRGKLKRIFLKMAKGIAVSEKIAQSVQPTSTIIGNAYDSSIFKLVPDNARDKDLIFVGRFVADKGIEDLLEALYILSIEGIKPSLTLIGTGPEEKNIREKIKELNIESQVILLGPVLGDALAKLLNQHRIMVIPSRWQEPFGIVALEGIACGCVIIGSEGGGLKEAIGPCGMTFPNGDKNALAIQIRKLITDDQLLKKYKTNSLSHLHNHQPEKVALDYLNVLFP